MSIILKNVSYTYDNNFQALENIDLEIQHGENIAIVGQNGAGKTTMVKLMNGLLKPTEGTVLINGMDTKEYTTAQIARKSGYVFQNPDDQIFHGTVLEEVAFAPKVLQFDLEKSQKMIDYAVSLTQIQDILEENPYNLPLSIRKFVTIAAVIAMDTDIIILDEPTAGQDYYGIKVLSQMIQELSKAGKTIITITHDMEFVINNFQKVIVMANKKIIKQASTIDTFSDNPILIQSHLKRPVISALSQDLNLPNNILYMEDLLHYIVEHHSP